MVELIQISDLHFGSREFRDDYCGTTASEKVRADDAPCFNQISLYQNELKISVVNSKNLQKSLLFHQIRGKMNYIKPHTARIEHIMKSNIFS